MPAGAVLSVPEVLAAPQVADRGLLARFEDAPGVGRDIEVVSAGFKLDGRAPRVSTPPPELGQDAAEIWGALGLGADDLARLRADGAI